MARRRKARPEIQGAGEYPHFAGRFLIGTGRAGRLEATCPGAPARPSAPIAAAARARERDQQFDHRVVLIAAARERLGGGGVETAVLDERLVDMERDHLADDEVIVERLSPAVLELHDLANLAFEVRVRLRNARRLHEPARRHRQAGIFELALAARQRRRSFAHRPHQVVAGEIGDEFAALRREGGRILEAFAGESDNRRDGRKRVEEAVGRQIDPPVVCAGGNPADRARSHDRLERIVRQQASVSRARLVVHSLVSVGSGKAADDVFERGPRALLRRHFRASDVNKAGYALDFAQTQRGAEARIISAPFGQPR